MADLVTQERAQQFSTLANIPVADLATLITVASAMVEEHCHRLFTSQTYNILMDGDDTRTLILPTYPVTVLTSIGVIDRTEEEETYLSATYFRFTAHGIVKWQPQYGLRFPNGFNNIRVIYTAGWTTIPETVQQAVCHVIQYLWTTQNLDMTAKSEQLGDYKVVRETTEPATYLKAELPGIIRGMLKNYVIMTVIGGVRGG